MEEIVNNEFKFYAKLAKPLILNLPKSKDRILAAAWIKKFMDEKVGDEQLRTVYLKLLLFCLQRRRLTGIFGDDPREYDVLEVLPPDLDLNELARNLLEQEKAERRDRIKLEMMGDMLVFPAYTTDCSPDLTEYVAAQDIPNFGVHAYYAISKQPINKWQRSEKAIFPKGVKSAIDTSITTTGGPLDLCVCTPKGAVSAPEVEEAAPADADTPVCKTPKKDKESERKKRRPKKMGQSPPTHPIGEVRHKVEEERVTPTWGTNLLDVRERTDIGQIEEPTEEQIQLEEEVSKLLEEEAAEEEAEGQKEQEDLAAKAEDMLNIIDEFKKGKLDKPKEKRQIKKPVLTSSLKPPKKKKKKKKDYGPKPANLPAEFADWTEKDLEEEGLTWADLVPVEEDIDAELQRIEDEANLEQDEFDDLVLDEYGGLTDYDKLIAEAEADLERHKTTYDAGVEEDEPVVELFDDEMEDLDDELNAIRAGEEFQATSPALTSGIPVTTPRRSPSPRRSKSPEKSFAEEEDVLLQHRASPLRSPKEDPTKSQVEPKKSKIPLRPSGPTIKDLNISKVFEEARSAYDQSFLQHEQEFEEEDEFERLEREFDAEERGSPQRSPSRSPSPAPPSPCRPDNILQRAQEQEALLRLSPERSPQQQVPLRTSPARSPQQQVPLRTSPARSPQQQAPLRTSPARSPQQQVPLRTSPARSPQQQVPLRTSPERSPQQQAPCRASPEVVQQQEELLGTSPERDYLQFAGEYGDAVEGLEEEQICIPCDSPPPLEEEPAQVTPPRRQLFSPTTGAPLDIPEFTYGREDVGSPDRFAYMKRPARSPEFVREREKKLGLRPPSPPTEEEQNYLQFAGDYEGAAGGLEEEQPCVPCSSPPPMTEEELFDYYESQMTPPRTQVYSPTSGAPLEIPEFTYGREDVASPERYDYMKKKDRTPEFIKERERTLGLRPESPPSPPSPPENIEEPNQLKLAEAMTRAWEQEVRLRQGSPQAREIIQEAETTFEGDRGRRLRIGQDKMIEESPPPGVKTPPKKKKEIELPPRPVFSPTTGQQLPVPEFDIAPEDLNVSWGEDDEEIPELTRIQQADYLYAKTPAEFQAQLQQDRTDIFERMGDPYTAAVDTAPIRPQYFPAGLDIEAVSPPHLPDALEQHEIPESFYDKSNKVSTCKGAQRRARTLRRQKWDARQVSPIQDDPYLEYLEKLREPHEYKGPVPQAKGLSPWRQEDVYYTPKEGDKTLEDIDWPLESPPKTPPCQRPDTRHFGFESPFYPGISEPTTPPLQRPEGRPEGFISPFQPGFSSPITPPWQYPRRRPEGYQTPPPPTPPSPLEQYWDPEAHIGMGLEDVEGLEDLIPVSPEPCTPCGAGRPPPPSRIRPGMPGVALDETPRQGAPMTFMDIRDVGPPPGPPLMPIFPRVLAGTPVQTRRPQLAPRKLFPEDAPCEPCETPTATPTKPPTPKKKIPSKMRPPGGKRPGPAKAPARAPGPRQRKPSPQRPPAPCAGDPNFMTPQDQRRKQERVPTDRRRPPPDRKRPARVDTPTMLGERRSRRLFEGDICEPCEQPPTPKYDMTPPRPPPYQDPQPICGYTPEGMAGPSRRPTELTPDGYNSDFVWTPPPPTPQTPKFPPARRIKKRSRPPPAPPTPPSPDTPPPPTPIYLKKPMYFPPEQLEPQGEEQLPTMEEIAEMGQQNRIVNRRAQSKNWGIGGGPGPYMYRDSRWHREKKNVCTPLSKRIGDIPEFEKDFDWEYDLMRRTDVDWFKYLDRPPSTQIRQPRPVTAEAPYRTHSPIQMGSPCRPCGGEEEVVEEEEDSDTSGVEDYLMQIFKTNIEVPPELYPPPESARPCQPCQPPPERNPVTESFSDRAFLERSEGFLAAVKAGNLTEHLRQREMDEIAERAMLFDDEAGTLADSPPPDMNLNYYPDIMGAMEQLQRYVQDVDLPESPIPSPFLQSPCYTPPRRMPPPCAAPPSGRQAAPPSRKGAAPTRKGAGPPRKGAPTPSQAEGGPCAPCGAAPGKKPSKPRIPPRQTQLRETRSTQLRKEQLAKKEKEKKEQAERLSPTSKMLKKRREKQAKDAENRKKAAAKKRAESMARVAEGLPGGKMRPKDYVQATGTGTAAALSATKDVPSELESHEGAAARKKLFGGPCPGAEGSPGQMPTSFVGRKHLGRKGASRGPEFRGEILEHEVDFPERQMGVVVGGGKYKHIPRRSEQALDLMGEIGEEDEPPCTPCSDDGMGLLDEMDEEMGVQPLQSPILTELGLLEQAMQTPQRGAPPQPMTEEDELLEFEEMERQMAMEAEEARRRTPPRPMTEEEEQMEFEELERQMAMEEQGQGVCPGSRSPRTPVPFDGVPSQQEAAMRKRLLEQQLATQGPRIRGRPFPAAGIAYSPPRPQGPFGPPPPRIPSPPRQRTPPQPITPPRQPTPPCQRSPGPPTPPSPPPSPPGLEQLSPPYIPDMEEGDRIMIPPSPPCWAPTPPPMPGPSPPAFIPTPPSPLLYPPEFRQQVASRARPEFDPARRRDILPRDDRRSFKAPCIGMYNVQEEEPLIPGLAGDESFMGGWPVVPGERAPRKRRRRQKELKAKRLFDKTDAGQLCKRIAKKFDLPKYRLPSPEEPDYILDDSIPGDLPQPMAPQWDRMSSPIRRQPLEPIPLAPWEEPGPPEPMFAGGIYEHRELYAGGGPVHPDLVDLVDYEPPVQIPEGIEDIGDVPMGEEMQYTPPRYPEIDERELDREAALAYEMPNILKNLWLTSPQDMGILTPPSCSKMPCDTYTPTKTPPLQLLGSPVIQDLNEAFLAPDLEVPTEEFQQFYERTPPLERETSLQEMKYFTWHAKGREGIKPRPQFFGGYGETPQRPVPRWYGRGGARNVLQEVEEPISPPTPGTPPPQLPAPCSPELTEFEELERQLMQDESRERGQSRRRRKRRELEDRQREMLLGDMYEQAERRDLEAPRPAPRMPSPPRSPSPQRVPTPRIPTPPPLPPYGYDQEMPAEGPCIPCDQPPIDQAALDQYLLEDMGLDTDARPDLTPPGMPEYLEQEMFDGFEGFESPPPLSPEAEAPCMPCTPPAAPSPPPAPPSPRPAPRSELDLYIERMERIEREKQEREERRQQLYQRNMEDIRQNFGPSPGPPSPGPDMDFYANVYSHQISPGFRGGNRPICAVRDQIGTREFTRFLPRHTPETNFRTIVEPRVRITVPEGPKRPVFRPRPKPKITPSVAAVKPGVVVETEKKASAQRIADARKHYQQTTRPKKAAPTRGPRPAPCAGAQPQPPPQLTLPPPVEQQAPPEGPCPGARPAITPEEAQRRARERLKARKKKEEVALSRRIAQAAPPPPPPPQPFTAFVPPQIRRMMPPPPPPPQMQPPQRGGPRGGRAPCAGRSQMSARPSTSGMQARRPPATGMRQPQGGGCGGSGQPCGSVRPGTSGVARARTAPQSQAQPELTDLNDFLRGGPPVGGGPRQGQEGPRRVVKKTSSTKRIVTRQNK